MVIRNRILRLNAGNNIEAVGTDFTLRRGGGGIRFF